MKYFMARLWYVGVLCALWMALSTLWAHWADSTRFAGIIVIWVMFVLFAAWGIWGWAYLHWNRLFVPDLDSDHLGRTVCSIHGKRMTLVEATCNLTDGSVYLALVPSDRYRAQHLIMEDHRAV